MMTDPIADMLTRIRNAQMANKAHVTMPASTMKESVVKVLIDEGYLDSYEIKSNDNKPELSIVLKYYNGKPVISLLKRASRPGLRVYKGKGEIPQVQDGLGVAIISTSKGVMTDRAARAANEGGEVICLVS